MDKKTLSLEDIESQLALELPDRQLLGWFEDLLNVAVNLALNAYTQVAIVVCIAFNGGEIEDACNVEF